MGKCVEGWGEKEESGGKVGFGVVCNGKKWRCEGFHRDPIGDSLGMDGFHRAFPAFHGDPIGDSLGIDAFHRDPIRDSLGMDGFHRSFPVFHRDPIRDSLGMYGGSIGHSLCSIGVP